MARTMRSHTGPSGIAVGVIDLKNSLPDLPFEVRQIIIGEYIKTALAERAFPDLSTLKRISYAFYKDELLPAVLRATVAHEVKHATANTQLLEIEAKFRAQIDTDLNIIHGDFEGVEDLRIKLSLPLRGRTTLEGAGTRGRIQCLHYEELTEDDRIRRRTGEDWLEAHDHWERIGSEILFLGIIVDYFEIVEARKMVVFIEDLASAARTS